MSEENAGDGGAPSVTEQIDALFAPWNRSDCPGVVVGVAKDGEVIYRRGFGMASLETFAANSPRTRMRIGSTSKHFTAMLALLLAEDGKLDLDAPIRTYLPELTGPGGDPSLRLLLQHRGGSRCYLDLGHIGRGRFAVPPIGDSLAAQVRQSGRNFAPGEAMIYNNGGYHLVSLAIERAGGAPFEAQLKQRLFDVVGMPDTASIPNDYEITPGIATMHVPLPGGGWQRGLFPSQELRGEGAMVSTVDDMLRWTAHLRSRDLFGSAESWAALTERPVFPDGSTGVYALGLIIDAYRGLKTVRHAGSVVGGSCQMVTLPEDGLDIIIMANGGPSADVIRLAEQVVDVVLADRVGPQAPSVPSDAHRGALGDWWSPETGMIYSLVDDAGELKLMFGMPIALPLQPAADGRVVSPGLSIGDIVLDLARAAECDEIRIAFGGSAASYRRISSVGAGDAAAFARAVVGRYFSPDAAATATIAPEDEGLVITVSDGNGAVSAKLEAKGVDVGATVPISPMDMCWWAVSLDRRDGDVVGFRLNTTRTRGLAFERI
jgi:D-aminopeptidase